MSATRYFYTDPLEAAWMAKHFKMRLQDAVGKEIGSLPCTNGCMLIYWHKGCLSEPVTFIDRYYIHPDSLYLLQRKIGDLVEHNGVEFGIVIGLDDKEVGIQYCEDSDGKTLHGMSAIEEIQIIQRDGKPFFWPGAE